MRLESPVDTISRCQTCGDSYISDHTGWPHPCQCPTCSKSRTATFELELDGQLCVKRVAIGNIGHGEGNKFAWRWFESLGYKVGPHFRRL